MKKYISILAIAFLWSCQSDSSSDTSNGGGAGQGGSLARFTIAGDHLYAVHNQSLNVFDISNNANAIYLSKQELFTTVETIFTRDSNTIFIGSTSGMFIYDVSSAPSIQRLSTYQHIVSCDPVVANEDYAYVTLRSDQTNNFCWRGVNQLDIVDIRDLSNPQLVSSFPMVSPRGLGLYGDTLMVCDEGLKVLNVADPNAIKLIDVDEDFKAIDLIPYGNLIIAVAEDGLSQYRYHKGKLNLLSRL
ncbi:LVIVD repeat-containing protein [Croceimicrobium hydrocarbonivorans]|uniref:LVIVD repeat-containing protein n=1 Tax=Croceimicrobium hydrocarbonivorans TaxID=2761580 RepID=A0A7H0VGW8_9FLAO|nr:hypothetical protein [Croceimicrobium hydrocarbonivorans]QNR24966.1 hypothetical protein H4K34_03740 [Croceimicrobium hydrocarbonivorans]